MPTGEDTSVVIAGPSGGVRATATVERAVDAPSGSATSCYIAQMALRAITSFHRDDEDHWVADLECGHTQHVRHRPPWEMRPWVETEEGRAKMVGHPLECSFCDMPALPAEVEVYRRTPDFDEVSVPRGLLTDHATKAGVWGRIVVEEGRLRYELADEANLWVLRPGVPGIIAPESNHRVTPLGPVRFFVEFLRVPEPS